MSRIRILNEYTTVAVLCAALVFWGFSIAQNYVTDSTTSYWWVKALLSATGTYFLLFRMFMWAYSTFLWAIINRRYYIGGHWDYTYDVYNNEVGGEFSRKNCPGRARITHTIEGVQINAESADREPMSLAAGSKTIWHTTACVFVDGRVAGGLEFRNERAQGVGFLEFNIVTNIRYSFGKPVELDGHFMFLEGGGKITRGRVVFRRSIVPSREEFKELISSQQKKLAYTSFRDG